MKKMVYSAVIVVLLSAVCQSCFLAAKQVPVDNYAGAYYEFDKIQAVFEDGYISLQGVDTEVYYQGSVEFETISDYYNDHGFNRKIVLHVYEQNNCVNAMHITSMDVICDGDYNSTHAAGASLSDIVHIVGLSPYRYIKGRFSPDMDWDSRMGGCSDRFRDQYERYFSYAPSIVKCGLYPLDGMLDKIDHEDLAMMGSVSVSPNGISRLASLYLTERMTCEECPVRIVLKLYSGEEMSCEFVLRRW